MLNYTLFSSQMATGIISKISICDELFLGSIPISALWSISWIGTIGLTYIFLLKFPKSIVYYVIMILLMLLNLL